MEFYYSILLCKFKPKTNKTHAYEKYYFTQNINLNFYGNYFFLLHKHRKDNKNQRRRLGKGANDGTLHKGVFRFPEKHGDGF